MKTIKHFLILAALLISTGCAWQKIPPAPEYAKEQPLALKVGVITAPGPTSALYVPKVVDELKAMRLFDSIVYPYQPGTPVNAVTTIAVEGEWKAGSGNPGLVVGLTLGLAGPFVGPSMTGVHDVKATVVNDKEDIGFYSTLVSTPVQWGVMADSREVNAKAEALQVKRLADALAKAIREDRTRLLAKANAEAFATAATPAKASPLRPKAARTAPAKPSARSAAAPSPEPARGLRQGLFSFEAEKIAIKTGCATISGIRPVALLVERDLQAELYQVQCVDQPRTVRCENTVCELAR